MNTRNLTIPLVGTVCAASIGLFAAIPEERSGTLFFDIGQAESPYSYGTVISGPTGVTKKGVGVLNLTGDNTYTGALSVEDGTLSAATTSSMKGLGNPSAVSVSSGATLDLSEPAGNASTAVFGDGQPVTISGAGVDGAGALRRTSGSLRYYLANDLALDADSSVYLGANQVTGFKNLNLNGHELTVLGAGGLRSLAGSITPGDGGCVNLGSSGYFQGATIFEGTSNNVFRMTGSGTTLSMNWLSNPIPWTLSVEENATLSSTDGNSPAANRWNGPVVIATNKTLTVKSDSSKRLNVNGCISGKGNLTVDGGGAAVIGGGLKLSRSSRLSTAAGNRTITISGGDGENSVNAISTYGGSLKLDGLDRLDVYSILQVRGYSWCRTDLTLTNTTLVSGGSCNVADDNGTFACVRIEKDAMLSVATLNVATQSSVSQTGKAAVGAVYQAGGDVSVAGLSHLAGSEGSYGYYGLEDGMLKLGDDFVFSNWGYAAMVQKAGVCTGKVLKVASKGGNALVWQKSGTMFSGVNLGTETSAAGAQSVLALEGSNSVFRGSFDYTSRDAGANGLVVVNDGAVFQVSRFSRSWMQDSITPQSGLYLFADGGVLRPSYAWGWANAEANRRPTAIVVQKNGVTCDTSMTAASGESSITIPFVAPTGKIVKKVLLPEDAGFVGEVFLGPPQVKIIGSGIGAVAAAVFNSKTHSVTEIRVLSAGTAYDDSTTAVVESADRTKMYSCAVELEDAPTATAGLKKIGNGMLVLSGANTWAGPTIVAAGTLKIANGSSLPTGGVVSVASGATLDLAGRTHTVRSVAGAGAISGSLRVTSEVDVAAGATPLTVSGTLAIGDGSTIVVTGVPDAKSVKPGTTYHLLVSNGGITYGKDLVAVGVPESWRLLCRQNGIDMKPRAGLCLIVF